MRVAKSVVDVPLMTHAALATWCRQLCEDGRAPAPPSDDLSALHETLAANRLVPAVARALRSQRTSGAGEQQVNREPGSLADVAPGLAATLHDEARLVAERSLDAIATLHRVARSLDGAGILWMLWKGPALSMLVWGEPAIRQFSDLDIVVAPRDRDAARAALAADGWRAQCGHSRASEHEVHAATRAYPLTRPGSTPIELHWAFAGMHYPSWGDVATTAARAAGVELGGLVVRTPSGADAVLLCALHATKHGWSQAVDVVLFTRLALREPNVVAIASARAEETGVGTAMRLGVLLAARLCDVRLPEHSASTREQARVRAMADDCISRMESGAGAWRETHAWTLGWVRRPSHRARYAAVALLAPTPQDREWLALPDALVWTYPLVRLVRLAMRSVGLAREGSRVRR